MAPLTEESKHWWCLGLILALALGLRLWGADWGLPHQYQTEEYKVIKYALRMGGGDLNPHFFEYPSLYLYFMLFVYGCYFVAGKILGLFPTTHAFAISYIQDPTCFHLLGRGFEALFGLGVVFMAYLIGRRVVSNRAGLVAAGIATVLPSAISTCHVTKGDLAAMFLGLAFWVACHTLFKTGQKRGYLFAGALLGLAVSTKYYLAPFGIALPLAHFFSEHRRSHGWLILSLALIPLFFIIGTPYALLAHREFLQFFQDQSSSFSSFTGPHLNFAERFLSATQRLSRMTDQPPSFLFGSYGLGLLCLGGLAAMAWRWQPVHALIIIPVLTYWLIVSKYHHPAAGYMAPVFPLMAVAGAFVVERVWTSGNRAARLLSMAMFGLVWFSAFGECARMAYAYTLPDTRTQAKAWMEAHVPPNSRILLDILVNNPPVEMSERQLKKFLDIAEKTNHYKKEFFRLKTEAWNPTMVGYDIVILKRSAGEIGSLPHQVEQTQQTQDLFEATGDAGDIKALKLAGIQYVVINSWSEHNALQNYPRLAEFYKQFESRFKPIHTIEPPSNLHPGPVIRIYKVE